MKISGNDLLEVLRFSDSRYEYLTVEIQYGGEPIVQVNQDGDELELEILPAADGSAPPVRMSVSAFQEALKLAVTSLKK